MRHALSTLLTAGLLPFWLAGCPGNNNDVEICDNTVDDDGNGQVDCDDAACAADPACEVAEICDNTIDDDGNGQVDCDDAACAALIDCEPVLDGFDNPESVFFDAGTNAFYVSNTGNFAGGTAGDGFISKIDATTGEVVLNFAGGLDSPTGLRANNGTLFVADGTNIRVIDLLKGQLLDTIDASAVALGGFLNDLAIDPANGDVYAADTFGNAIIRVPAGNGAPEIFLQDVALEGPNGLLVEGTELLIASLGPDLQPDFTTSAPGQLLSIDLTDPNLTINVLSINRIGALDGLELDGQNLITTDFAGKIFSVDANGQETLLLDGTADIFAAAAADIGFDSARRIVAAPQLFGTTVTFVDLDNL